MKEITQEDKMRKEFIDGYLAAIQNLTLILVISESNPNIEFLAEALQDSGFSKEEFMESQKKSGFQEDEMKLVLSAAFST